MIFLCSKINQLRGDTCSEHHRFAVDGSQSFEETELWLVVGWLFFDLPYLGGMENLKIEGFVWFKQVFHQSDGIC